MREKGLFTRVCHTPEYGLILVHIPQVNMASYADFFQLRVPLKKGKDEEYNKFDHTKRERSEKHYVLYRHREADNYDLPEGFNAVQKGYVIDQILDMIHFELDENGDGDKRLFHRNLMRNRWKKDDTLVGDYIPHEGMFPVSLLWIQPLLMVPQELYPEGFEHTK